MDFMKKVVLRKQIIIPCVYSVMQIILLFCLRKFLLLTVFQTVASYVAVCLLGLGLGALAIRNKGQFWESLSDSYLILWSGFHGVIVLGFLTCGTYYLTLTQVTIVQLVNIFLGFALYWFFYLLTGRAVLAVGLGNLLIGIVGTVNYYLVRFRGAPFRIEDIFSLETAGNVVNNYDFTPGAVLIVGILDLVVWYLVWRVALKDRQRRKRRNVCMVVGTVVIGAGCIALPIVKFQQIHANTNQFAQDCYLADLTAEIMGSTQKLPENYSVEAVEQIVKEYRDGAVDIGQGSQVQNADGSAVSEEYPNIVVIMNEAFSDLRVLGDFETSAPVLEYWDSLQENCIRGWANVSILGGNTANSEYEFLTSDSVALYPNTIPYNKYFTESDEYPGMVSVMEQLGYETTAFHPYLASGWNRTQVYRSMGFDNIFFLEDMEEELDTLRIYTSDKGDYDFIRKYFDEKQPGSRQFFFNITMQNHSGYTYEGDNFETTVQLTGDMAGKFPQAEQYLSLMKASDEALEGLLNYFEAYEEPTIVVLFGDHQPRLEDGFYEYVTGQPTSTWDLEQHMQQYKTPFIIWHNYDVESKEVGDIALSYLASLLLENTGLPMSEYQRYVWQQYQEIPVLNSLGIRDAKGNLFSKGSAEYQALSEKYKLLMYNHTVDIENRVEGFYELKE